MVVTESGMVMLANTLHRSKAQPPMVVTESGMAMVSNELHLEKAQSPMVVTESGIVTVFTAFLSTPHPSHESSPFGSHGRCLKGDRDTIMVVPSGMSKCPSALTLTAAIAEL